MSVRANARLIPTFVTTLVMLVIPSSSTYSQKLTGQYLQTTWTTENGLPQNSVNAIVQTRDGYLWLATFGGLARFDGIRFTIFDTGNTPALKSTRIIALYEDSQGGLWIGGEFGGVARFASNQFTSWGTKEGMVDGKVNFISADREGNVWIGTDRGLARYRSGRFTTITQAHGYPGHTGIRMSESSDGSLWFLSEVGITQYRKGSFTNTWPIDVIYQANFIGLDETEDGDLLISSARALMSFRYGAGTPIAHYKTDSARESPGRVIRSFRERSGKLTFLTTSGLAHFRNGQINDYIKIPAISQLTENVLLIRAVIEDREGNIWIGTDGKGLHRIRKAQIDSYAGEEGLIDASFLTVTQDAEGAMWFLCDAESGPYRMSEGVIRNLDWKVLAGHGPRHSILHASDGTIWIGDYVQISVIRDGRLVDRIVLDKNPTAGIPIPAIFEDKDGIIWIGAATDTGKGGLYRFADGQLTLFRTNEGLVHNNVRRIMQDSHGALWIGTYGGLSCFKDGKFTNYTTENGLTHNYVREIYEATDGAIWLGTYGGGLLRMKDGKFVSITTRDGLFDNVVSRILEDDRGNFWMSCNRGIFRVSHKELDEFADGKIDSVNSVNYGVTDGMKSSECNGGFQPAGWKARDGTLWFPTQKGIAVVDPSQISTIPPSVAVEAVLTNGHAVPFGERIKVAPGNGDLEIRYTGLSFAAPEKIRFRYMLEGRESEWVNVGDRRTAYYTNLSPGNYRFRVIACNNDGVWNETGAAVEFYLKPHFYQTRMFYIVLALLAAMGVFIGHRLRLRHLLRKTSELEARVAERTAKVVAQSGELSQVNADLQTANTLLEKVNERLGQANEDMLATLNQLRLGVMIADKNEVVTFFSEAAQRLLDKPASEVVGKHWEQSLPLDERDRLRLRSLMHVPSQQRPKLPVRVETSKDRACWMEIEIREDPRDADRTMFLLYDVTEVYDLRRLLDDKAQFHGMIGQSLPMQLLYKQIEDLAQVDTTVLITGETGTGKELAGRAIHYSSARKSKPFIAVNCAGLTESLLTSQLFGHKRGSFTGAVTDQVGLVESAAGGALFLDEIGDIPVSVQTTLLRVLQEKEIIRLGESKPRKVDVRIITATHRDLAEAVATKSFREDLFYRIRVARIEMPPLRQRLDDLPLLVAWFLGQIRNPADTQPKEFSRDAIEVMMKYQWPGNVRELRSAVESAVIRCHGQIIQPEDLPADILSSERYSTPASGEVYRHGNDEADRLRQALEKAGGKRAEAARRLGISRSTLYRRLAALHILSDEDK